MVEILFENVGNSRRSTTDWEARLKEFNGQSILHEIKKRRLLEGEPDIWYNQERTHGKIYIGGYKFVGTFRIKPPENQPHGNEHRNNKKITASNDESVH